MHGGQCQFFANDPDLAPLVPEALTELSAQDHRVLYEEFLAANQIDPTDLSEFDTTSVEAFSALYDRYPWDDFNIPYCELTPMTDFLESCVQAHADDFQSSKARFAGLLDLPFAWKSFIMGLSTSPQGGYFEGVPE